MKKIALILILVLSLTTGVFLMSACNSHESNFDRKIVDLKGREVELDNPDKIDSIVALGTGALRLVAYLDAMDKVTGVESIEKGQDKDDFSRRPYNYLNYEYLQSDSVSVIGTQVEANYEAILALNPDVIFCTYNDDQFANLESKIKNIPIVRIGYTTSLFDQNILRSIDIIADVLGVQARAEYIKGLFDTYFADLSDRTDDIAHETKPNVYIGGVSYAGAKGFYFSLKNYSPFMAVGAQNVVDKLNIVSETGGSVMLDPEFVHGHDIDIVFIDTSNLSLVRQEYAKAQSSFDQMKAIKNGRVYGTMSFNFYSTNIELAFATSYFVGKMIYPDRFQDVDITAKTNEIMTAFLGSSCYDILDKQGYGLIGETISLA